MILLSFIMLSSAALAAFKLVPSSIMFLSFISYFALVTVNFTNNNSNLISNEDIRLEKGHICETFVQMNKGATDIILKHIL
jgi:hypothetical protein